MLLDHCYCPYICTILKYVHHFANIAKEKEIKEAEGRAEAIRAVQQATADGLRAIKEAGADDSVIRLKALEAFEKAANGQATKIIVPSDIAGMAGLAKGIVESVKEDQ